MRGAAVVNAAAPTAADDTVFFEGIPPWIARPSNWRTWSGWTGPIRAVAAVGRVS